MKKWFTLFIALITTLAFASEAQSQILKRLKDRVQQKVEDKVEQKVNREIDQAAEEMVEKSWNSIFGEGFSAGDSSSGFSFPMNSNVNTEESYRFDVVTTMEIENTDPNGDRQPPVTMYMHFNENENYSGTRFRGEEMDQQEGDVFMIYDVKNEALVMLMESEDEKYALAYNWGAANEFAEELEAAAMDGGSDYETDGDAEYEQEDEWPGYEKIGTRTIAGSVCEGYRSESDYERTEIWVSQDHDAGLQRMFRANSGTKHLKGKVPDDYPMGMIMEMTHENLETGETTVMRVTDVARNANVTLSMSDYPMLSFGDMMNQQ
ncbi:DUF4412 domain-containing protein [Rhodohalobacter mucosus]|uniref:Uncharacterized protein n=1 Tax=Rhodohalobacter mucosus TaxID=2079485 RepID=A0A316TPE8_9BACT|nr:DUF4412 domain-containing protein [Rhodohalobacter mucosus]PWN05089.1 hypothetical protein DDZ15_16160 [Rhodohalobacter mucosus]